VVGALAVTVIGLLAPLAALAVRSFYLGGAFTLRYYAALGENPRQSAFFVPPITAIANSLLVCVATLAISLPLGVIARTCWRGPRWRWGPCSTRCCCCRWAPRR
jgi:thiamine transport system permease protein